MEITQVRVFPVHEDKLKAFVSIVIDDCFVVSDIKIIQGTSGLFISMPSKKRKNGTFRDIAHPLNSETRLLIEGRIIEEYRAAIEAMGTDDSHVGSPEGAPGESLDETQGEPPAGAGGPRHGPARTATPPEDDPWS